ncbi:MAG: diacylglycerol kinase [Nocardioidaceae bacterium]|nr:diacylglycerol kinase [Nocardioidaceae bacterium]
MITNADAGTNDRESVDLALAVLRESAEVEVAETASLDELDGILHQRDGRTVVVAGGDGSLHAVVAALQRRGELDQPTIGLIPLGTGNDFARSVQIPLDPARAARVVGGGRTGRIDILVDDDGGVVVNAVHAGAGADAAREAKRWKKSLGKVGYALGAVIAGFKVQGEKLHVLADREVLANGRRRVLQVGVGNGSYVGGGTALIPGADPTDGQVDVMVSFAVRRKDRLLYAIHLRRGTHDERHDVHTVRASVVEIHGRAFWCNTDGELSGPLRRQRWTVRPQAFTMLLPSPEQAEPSA